MTLVPTGQQDFRGGAWPLQEDVPPNGCEDIVNGLIRDDGAVERRGGSTYKSDATMNTGSSYEAITAIWDGYMSAVEARRTLFRTNGTGANALNGTSPVGLLGTVSGAGTPVLRVAEVGGLVFGAFATTGTFTDRLFVWAGNVPATSTSASSSAATVATGSKTVTFSVAPTAGALAQGGLFGNTTTYAKHAAVKSVDSTTQITLVEPWPYPSLSAASYDVTNSATTVVLQTDAGVSRLRTNGTPLFVAAIFGRLVVAQGEYVYFSAADAPFSFTTDDYHRVTDGAQIVGLQVAGDRLMVFTTGGVFAIDNMAYDLTDDLGNPQQRMSLVNRDVVLWGEAGLSTWRDAMVVPAVDDLLLMGPSGEAQPVTGGMRNLYRQYVKSGSTVGQAAVHRGHYILPVLSSATTVQDVLVWRLDMPGAPAARWDGYSAGLSYVASASSTSRSPKLYVGVKNADNTGRMLDATDVFEPAAAVKNEANASTHQLKVTTRTQMASEMVSTFWKKVRVRYELDDAASDNPTLTAEWAETRPGSSFSSLSGSASEGQAVYSWYIRQRAQQIRVRVTSNGATSRCILRAVEFFVRQTGRQ